MLVLPQKFASPQYLLYVEYDRADHSGRAL
jgi:hypothetical protein